MSGLRRFPRRRSLRSLRSRQLFLELLEDRRVLSTFTVNSAGDEPDKLPGDGKALTINNTTTLRAAIMEANTTAGSHTIRFDIPGAGPHVIQPVTVLPGIINPVTIDGYTQPGSQRNTRALSEGCDAVLQIELDGTLAPAGTNGLEIVAGNSTVRGLVIHSFFMTQAANPTGIQGFGIVLGVSGGNVIEGCFIGTDRDGTSALGNTSGIGLFSANNTIGGTAPESRNVISGNLWNGIQIGGTRDGTPADVSGNIIQGNYIGLDKDGIVPLSNDNGIRITSEAQGNTIGGAVPGAGNVISGNRYQGILIDSQGGGSNVIQGNFIGTDKTGVVTDTSSQGGYRLGNAYEGIELHSSYNVIGGALPGAGNVISGNGGSGVLIVGPRAGANRLEGNHIGTDVTGTVARGNAMNGVELPRAQ